MPPLHQLVGVAPEEHRPALIHELRPIVVQLVVCDPLGVILVSRVCCEGLKAQQQVGERPVDLMQDARAELGQVGEPLEVRRVRRLLA
jgi:hypothetical protein